MTRSPRTVMAASLALLLGTVELVSRPAAAQPADYTPAYGPPPAWYPPPQPGLARPRKLPAPENEGPVVSWEPLRFAVVVETQTIWPIEGGAQRLAGERYLTSRGLSLQGDVLRPHDKLVLRVDAGWVASSVSSLQEGSGLKEQVDSNLFQLGASVRYELAPWLGPYARVAAGLGWDKLFVAGMRDRDVFEQGSAGAGILLRSPALRVRQGSWAPPIGLIGMVEGGYTLATGSDFVLRPELGSSGTPPIPSNTVALGHIGRSAPYLRAAFGLAF